MDWETKEQCQTNILGVKSFKIALASEQIAKTYISPFPKLHLPLFPLFQD